MSQQTMLERVARAICVAAKLDPDGKFKSSNYEVEIDPHLFAWQEFLQEARSAIKAMREPTDAMVDAGNSCEHDEAPATYYQAMVEAALMGA